MFTVADPRPTPTAPMDLPQTKTGPGASPARRASRLSRTAPDVMHGHHSSLLAALREEDTDDEFDDDDAFAFAPKGEGTPSTPRGTHRVFAAGKESMDSPTSPLVTHTKPHTKTYGFAPAASLGMAMNGGMAIAEALKKMGGGAASPESDDGIDVK